MAIKKPNNPISWEMKPLKKPLITPKAKAMAMIISSELNVDAVSNF